MESRARVESLQSVTVADVLERVLDKGVVIAGDIKVQIADIDLITIKIRLMIASVDKAREMGIDWWEKDSYLSSTARETAQQKEIKELKDKLQKRESEDAAGSEKDTQPPADGGSAD